MKAFTKDELTLTEGLFISNLTNEVVCAPADVVRQANNLDYELQKAKFLDAQPKAKTAPSLDDFHPRSNFDIVEKFKADTPILDKKVEKTLSLMNEIDNSVQIDAANEMLNDYKELLRFVESNRVICYTGDIMHALDTPELGNILKLSVDDIKDAIRFICKVNH